jgi:hypothetical protein
VRAAAAADEVANSEEISTLAGARASETAGAAAMATAGAATKGKGSSGNSDAPETSSTAIDAQPTGVQVAEVAEVAEPVSGTPAPHKSAQQPVSGSSSSSKAPAAPPLATLRTKFHKPAEVAARELGLSVPALLAACRSYRVERWPYESRQQQQQRRKPRPAKPRPAKPRSSNGGGGGSGLDDDMFVSAPQKSAAQLRAEAAARRARDAERAEVRRTRQVWHPDEGSYCMFLPALLTWGQHTTH